MDPLVQPDESDCCNSGCNPCILDVYEQLKKYAKSQASSIGNVKTTKNCLSPTSYSVFKTVNIEKHADDAFLFTFEFLRPQKEPIGNVDEDLCISYTPGQYFMLKAGRVNEEFTRAYTPIPIANTGKLQFTSLIKIYEVGRMSNYLRRLAVGKETIWRGPYGDFNIKFDNKYMLLIAQGTGIAPLFSVINDIVNNENCSTFLKLFYCCRSGNIYLRDHLYALQSYWNFTYEVFLSDENDISPRYNEIVHRNRLQMKSFQNYLVDKSEGIQVLISGSENFMHDIKRHVLDCNISEENIFLF